MFFLSTISGEFSNQQLENWSENWIENDLSLGQTSLLWSTWLIWGLWIFKMCLLFLPKQAQHKYIQYTRHHITCCVHSGLVVIGKLAFILVKRARTGGGSECTCNYTWDTTLEPEGVLVICNCRLSACLSPLRIESLWSLGQCSSIYMLVWNSDGMMMPLGLAV